MEKKKSTIFNVKTYIIIACIVLVISCMIMFLNIKKTRSASTDIWSNTVIWEIGVYNGSSCDTNKYKACFYTGTDVSKMASNTTTFQGVFDDVYDDSNYTMHVIKLPAGTFNFTKKLDGTIVSFHYNGDNANAPINNFKLVGALDGNGNVATILRPFSRDYISNSYDGKQYTHYDDTGAQNYWILDKDGETKRLVTNDVEKSKAFCMQQYKSGSTYNNDTNLDACIPGYLDMFFYNAKSNSWKYLTNVYFNDFIIDSVNVKELGYLETSSGKGFMINLCNNCHWDNVTVQNTGATGFGMDNVWNSSITNCTAINCGSRARDIARYRANIGYTGSGCKDEKASDYTCQLSKTEGQSGFGVGTGYSNSEGMYIENCVSKNNAKYGYFFEHQGRFGTSYNATSSRGFVVVNSYSENNMYNYGGERANDVVFVNNSSKMGANTLLDVMFKPQSRNTYSINTSLGDSSYYTSYVNSFNFSNANLIKWALEKGITYANRSSYAFYKGIGNPPTLSKGNQELTRADAIMMLWQLAGMPGTVVRPTGDKITVGNYSCYANGIWDGDSKEICLPIDKFNDVSAFSDYQSALKWAIDKKIVNGATDSKFNPSSSIIYKQALTFIHRYLDSSEAKKTTLITSSWAKNSKILNNIPSSITDDTVVTWEYFIRLLYNIGDENWGSFVTDSYNTNITYPISYYLVKTGANVNNRSTYTTGSKVTINGVPGNVAGYTFGGWIGSNGNTAANTITIAAKSAGPKAYVAKWDINKVTIKYNVNADDVVINSSNYRKSGKIIEKKKSDNSFTSEFHKVNYGNISDLYNFGTFGIRRDGYHIDADSAWCTQSGECLDQNKDFIASKYCSTLVDGDCIVTLYANWKPNKVTIKYNGNGATSFSGNTDSYQMDSNGWIKKSVNNVFTDAFDTLNYGEKEDLYNYNNSAAINLSKTGHYIPCDLNANGSCKQNSLGHDKLFVWKDKTTNQSFDQEDSYSAEDLCADIVNNSCTVNLYANWQPQKINIRYNVNNGNLNNTDNYSSDDKDGQGFILKNGSSILSSYTYSASDEIGDSGLPDYNAERWINLSRPGYYIPCKETNGICDKDSKNNDIPLTWCTQSGVCFDQVNKHKISALYNARNSCNTKTGICGLDLYANWQPSKYFVHYNGNGATGQTYNDNTQCNSDNECGLARYKEGSIYTNGVFKHSREWIFDNNEEVKLVTNRFVRDGYTFVGWNTMSNGTGASYEETQPVRNLATVNGTIVTLYAQWEQNIVTGNVTYNCTLNGGSTSNTTVEYQAGANVDLTKSCTKTGWEHIGWGTNRTDTTPLESYTMPSEGVTLYAIYKKAAITLYANFNANGATLSGNLTDHCEIPEVYNRGTQATTCTVTAPTITRSNYTVIGYNITYNTKVNSGKYDITTGKLTLNTTDDKSPGRTWYALTTPIRYKITFESAGVVDGYSSVYVEYDSDKLYKNETSYSLASIPTTSIDGYEFDGWYSGNNKVIDANKNIVNVSGIVSNGKWIITSDTTLTANWKKISEVTYNCTSNGGSTENTSVQFTQGNSVNLNKSCTKAGWEHVGWNTNRTAIAKLDSYTMPDTDVTLYAIYKKAAVTLTANFNANGATLSDSALKTCVLSEVYNNAVQDQVCSVYAPTITRNGYKIIGYNTSANSTDNNSDYNLDTGELILNATDDADDGRTWYAITVINRYKITFDAPSDTIVGDRIVYVDTTTNEVYQDENSNTPGTIPTAHIDGYRLMGWYANGNKIVEADGTVINNSEYVTNGRWTITGDLRLNSVWKELYSVTYDCTENGGTGANSVTEHIAGDSVDLTKTCTKSGWEHIGWNTNKDATVGLNSYTISGDDVTLYAIYKKPAVTLKANFNANGATLSSTESKLCTIEEVYNKATQASECLVTAPTIIRDGYTVIGYNTSASDTVNSPDYNVTTRTLSLKPNRDAGMGKTWYAITTSNRHKITFNVYPGTISGANIVYVEYNSDKVYRDMNTNTTVALPTASLDGYAFKGWGVSGKSLINEDASLENASGYISDGKWTITSDIVVFPRWEKVSETTYDCATNGGTGANTSVSYSEGATVDLTKTCTKSGWNFVGWNTNKNATVGLSSYVMPNDDVTLYAIYMKEAVTLSARFNANGATLIQSNDIIVTENMRYSCNISAVYNNSVQDTTCDIIAPKITRVGYTIIGFNTDPNSGVKSSNYNTNGTLTLNVNDDTENGRIWYALTRANRYKVTFDVGTGGGSGSTILYVEYDSSEIYQDTTSSTLGTIPTASLDGYEFLGWFTSTGVKLIDPDGTINTVSKFTSNNKWIITENKTLYAHYRSIQSEEEPEDAFEFIDKTDYDVNEDVVFQLTPGMEKEALFSKVETNGTLEVVDIDDHIIADDAKLRTGYKLKATFTTKVLEYTISVKGDVLGTGELSTDNAQMIAKHIIDKDVITGDEYLLAADYNGDGEIRSNDIVKMLKDKKLQENP